MMARAIRSLEEEGRFPKGKGRLPRGEIVPRPEVDEAVASRIFLLAVFRSL